MKTNIKRNTIRVALVAAALLATGFFGSAAKAQAGIQGKFTLPQETRWGRAVLPAGDYMLIFVHDSLPTRLVIRDGKNSRNVAIESIDIREDSTTGESALLIGARGTQRVVHSLRIAELGEVFVYDPDLAHGRVVEEARQAQVVPVLMAKK
jgi:hypothetical protein